VNPSCRGDLAEGLTAEQPSRNLVTIRSTLDVQFVRGRQWAGSVLTDPAGSGIRGCRRKREGLGPPGRPSRKSLPAMLI
jgi:hypothetical protein